MGMTRESRVARGHGPRRRALLALALAVTTGWPAMATAQPSAAALAQSVQAHYQQVKDFTASFEQAYVGGALALVGVAVARRKPRTLADEVSPPA